MMGDPVRTLGLLLLLLAGACRSHDHGHGDEAHGHGDDLGHGAGAVAVTRWTDRTEIFVEYPPLVVGQESAFAAHLTQLSDFQPVAAGRLIVVLSGGDAPEERFEVAAPSVPGIFRPVVTPRHAGARRLVLSIESEALSDTHDLGEVTVYADAEAARAAAGEEDGEDGSVSFLKEQQWRIPFATAAAGERRLRPSLPAYGTLRARSDGEVHVTAPVAGRLVTSGSAFPRIGIDVTRDQVLAVIAPRLAGADVATLELAVERARLARDHARRERERLERLHGDGVVPERRVAAARHAESRAAAELTAAERRLRQHRRIQRSAGGAPRGGVQVRAPLGGTIVAVRVAPGAFVEEGQALLHIVDLDRLWLEVRIPEANVGRASPPAGAWFEVDGFDSPFEVPASKLVATGGIVEPGSRTVPFLFEVDNPGRRLRAGMSARAHVLTGEPTVTLAIPESALVEDGGQRVAFVQVGGESFERRAVVLGIRDAGFVQVLGGIRAGERVVVRGAYAVKLAASSTAIPAHGHAH